MKSTIIISILFVIGCAGMPSIESTPVCPPPTDSETGFEVYSWICEKSSEIGIQPESIAQYLFDSSVIAILSGVERAKLCDFTESLGNWYARNYPISYSGLLKEIIARVAVMDETEALLIMTALNRHLRAYENPIIITQYDDKLLRGWWKSYRADMLCE